jgi:hypothetical protein
VAAGQRTLSFASDGRLTANGAHQPTLRSMLGAPRAGAAAAAPLAQTHEAAAAAPWPGGGSAADDGVSTEPLHAGGDDDADDGATGETVISTSLTQVSDQISRRPIATAAAASGTLDAYLPEHAARAAELERADARQQSATPTATKQRLSSRLSQPVSQIVVTAAPSALVGTLGVGDCEYQCTVGRGGVKTKGAEGDGVTPVGLFALGRVFFRPDRCAPPATMGMIVAPVNPDDGWCDDPSDGEFGHDCVNNLAFLNRNTCCA